MGTENLRKMLDQVKGPTTEPSSPALSPEQFRSELAAGLRQLALDGASNLAQLVEYLRQELAPAVRPVPPARFLTRRVQLCDADWDGSDPQPFRPVLQLNPQRRAAWIIPFEVSTAVVYVPLFTADEQAAQSLATPQIIIGGDDRYVALPPPGGSPYPLPLRVEGGGRLWAAPVPTGFPAVGFLGVIEELDE